MTRGMIGLGAAGALSPSSSQAATTSSSPSRQSTPPPAVAEGVWTAVATNVEETPDGLRVDLAIRNDTGDWSAMEIAEGGSVSLVDASGSSSPCGTAVVETGGASIPPGFIMRGFTGGTRTDPQVELLRVECEGAAQAAGSKLRIPYSFTTGEFNFYRPDPPQSGTLEVDLDAPVTDLAYPAARRRTSSSPRWASRSRPSTRSRSRSSTCERSADEIQFTWRTENPTNYQAYVHIGNPPVIGSDGILYGRYTAPHLVDTPITLANESAEWTTTVAVPADVQGLFALPGVESKQQKNYVSHAIDLTDG